MAKRRFCVYAFYNEKCEGHLEKWKREVEEEGVTCESGHKIKESHDRQRLKMECVWSR